MEPDRVENPPEQPPRAPGPFTVSSATLARLAVANTSKSNGRGQETAAWVFGAQKELYAEWLAHRREEDHTTKTAREHLDDLERSSEHASCDRSWGGSTYQGAYSDASILDVDFLQALEDVLLAEPPRDLQRPFNCPKIVTARPRTIGHTSEDLIEAVVKSSRTSADVLEGSLGHSQSLESNSASLEETNRASLRDLLRDQRQLVSHNSDEKDMYDFYFVLLDTLLQFRSAPKQKRNSLVIEDYVSSGSLEAFRMYQCVRGLTPISTTPINAIESVISTSRLLFSIGALALARFRCGMNQPHARNYVNVAIKFFLLDLSYGADLWESWYGLAQCYEAVACGPSVQTPRSIRCYILAIASAQQVDSPCENGTSTADLYYDFGVSVYFDSKAWKDGSWKLTESATLKMAISMFRTASILNDEHAASHLMLAVSSSYQILDDTMPALDRQLWVVIRTYWKTLRLLQTPQPIYGWHRRYDLYHEIIALFDRLQQDRTTRYSKTQAMANMTIAVLLQRKKDFDTTDDAFYHQSGPASYRWVHTSPLLPADNRTRDRADGEAAAESPAAEAMVVTPSLHISSSLAPNTSDIVPAQDKGVSTLLASPKEAQPKKLKRKRITTNRTDSVTNPPSKLSKVDKDKIESPSQLELTELIRLAVLYEKERKVILSMKYFNLLTNPPKGHDRASWWLEAAPLLEEAGKPDVAMKMYKMVLERNSESAEALQHLGRLYHEENDSRANQDRAIGYLERAVAFDKTNARTWHQLGLAYVSRGFNYKAHEAFKHAIHRDKQYVDCWLSLGALNVRMKLYDEAQQSYDAAIKLDQKKVDSWIQLGNLMQQMGRFAKAIDSFQKATDLDPSNSVAKRHLKGLISANRADQSG